MAEERKVTTEEAQAVIKSVDEGRSQIVALHESWKDTFAGNCEFQIIKGEFVGWTVVWFNDCDSWDYLDCVISPDGRRLDFDDIAPGPNYTNLNPLYASRGPENEAVWEAAPVCRDLEFRGDR